RTVVVGSASCVEGSGVGFTPGQFAVFRCDGLQNNNKAMVHCPTSATINSTTWALVQANNGDVRLQATPGPVYFTGTNSAINITGATGAFVTANHSAVNVSTGGAFVASATTGVKLSTTTGGFMLNATGSPSSVIQATGGVATIK